MTATITLTEQELAILSQIAQQTGKTEEELLRNALTHYLSHLHPACRRQVLHEARGMWHDRNDLPNLTTLREEFDR